MLRIITLLVSTLVLSALVTYFNIFLQSKGKLDFEIFKASVKNALVTLGIVLVAYGTITLTILISAQVFIFLLVAVSLFGLYFIFLRYKLFFNSLKIDVDFKNLSSYSHGFSMVTSIYVCLITFILSIIFYLISSDDSIIRSIVTLYENLELSVLGTVVTTLTGGIITYLVTYNVGFILIEKDRDVLFGILFTTVITILYFLILNIQYFFTILFMLILLYYYKEIFIPRKKERLDDLIT